MEHLDYHVAVIVMLILIEMIIDNTIVTTIVFVLFCAYFIWIVRTVLKEDS